MTQAYAYVLLVVSVLTMLAASLTTLLYENFDGDSTVRKATESMLVAVTALAQMGMCISDCMKRAHIPLALGIFAVYSVVVVFFAARFFVTKPIKGLSSAVDTSYAKVYTCLFIVLALILNLAQMFGPTLLVYSFSTLSWKILVGVIASIAVCGVFGAVGYVFVNRLTPDEIRQRLGASKPVPVTKPPSSVSPASSVPDQFDCRTKWPDMITPIRNQQACGCCVAFATTSVLADRWCIGNGSHQPVLLSPQYVMQTADVYRSESPPGCSGADVPSVMAFLTSSGTVLNSCFPYQHGTSYVATSTSSTIPGLLTGTVASTILAILAFAVAMTLSPGYVRGGLCLAGATGALGAVAVGISACVLVHVAKGQTETVLAAKECTACVPSKCVDDSDLQLYKFTEWYNVAPDEVAIKQEIYGRGPVVAVIEIYSNFPGGVVSPGYVYMNPANPTAVEYHAVSIIGWNPEGWIIRNQWGTWGDVSDPGCITIGYGQAGIEDSIVAGL